MSLSFLSRDFKLNVLVIFNSNANEKKSISIIIIQRNFAIASLACQRHNKIWKKQKTTIAKTSNEQKQKLRWKNREHKFQNKNNNCYWKKLRTLKFNCDRFVLIVILIFQLKFERKMWKNTHAFCVTRKHEFFNDMINFRRKIN